MTSLLATLYLQVSQCLPIFSELACPTLCPILALTCCRHGCRYLSDVSMLAVPRIALSDLDVSMTTIYEEADKVALKYLQTGHGMMACLVLGV